MGHQKQIAEMQEQLDAIEKKPKRKKAKALLKLHKDAAKFAALTENENIGQPNPVIKEIMTGYVECYDGIAGQCWEMMSKRQRTLIGLL